MNVLITGSSSGFGRITAEVLAESGHHVFATMRNIDTKNAEAARGMAQWGEEKGHAVTVSEMDVTSETSVRSAVDEILSSEGHIDVVVNNAGVGTCGLLETFTIKQTQALFDVNTFGPMRVNRAVLPSMRKRKSGLLLHITSAAGRLYFPTLSIYSATKYALEALSESYAEELATFNIDSVSIEPGAFPTNMGPNALLPDDTDRLEGYGEVAELPDRLNAFFGRVMSGSELPDPREVANTIRTIIDTPSGDRPIRVVVGEIATKGIDELNRITTRFQREYTASFEF